MRLLTDSPERCDDDLLLGARWEAVPVERLAPPECRLWRVLSDGDRCWRAERDGDLWTHLVVIGDAPGSQLDALQSAFSDGLRLPGPTACLALTGRRFRGQRGRTWEVEPGNLFLTLGLEPDAAVSRLVPGLTLLPALAVLDALRGLRFTPGIKWVNDVLIDDAKVAGVLTGTHVQADRVRAAALGIGINVARAPSLDPTPFVPRAGCLADTRADVGLADCLWRVLDAAATRYRTLLTGDGAALLDAYREASLVVGRRVRVFEEGTEPTPDGRWPPPIVEGVVRSIETDLSLRLLGRSESVDRGRLALVDSPQSQAGRGPGDAP